MIKINLRPDMAAIPESVDPNAEVLDADIQRKGIVNIIVMLILPLALYVYGAQAKPEKERAIATLNQQISELTEFNEKQNSIVAEIHKIEKDEKDVEKKISAIHELTQGRLAEIKILDLLQSITRDKMWLRSIEIQDSKILIEGMALSEMDVSIFLEDMTKNLLFRDVRLVESQQVIYDTQNYSKFNISAYLEKSK